MTKDASPSRKRNIFVALTATVACLISMESTQSLRFASVGGLDYFGARYLSDHLGSTSIVASATGTVEEESDYYPFGTEVVVSGPGG